MFLMEGGHLCYSYTMDMSGLPDMYTLSPCFGCTYQANHECTWYNCYVPYSPSPGKLKSAQARKHASLQPHCIYRENCWD